MPAKWVGAHFDFGTKYGLMLEYSWLGKRHAVRAKSASHRDPPPYRKLTEMRLILKHWYSTRAAKKRRWKPCLRS